MRTRERVILAMLLIALPTTTSVLTSTDALALLIIAQLALWAAIPGGTIRPAALTARTARDRPRGAPARGFSLRKLSLCQFSLCKTTTGNAGKGFSDAAATAGC